jgi:hypothetical protein
VSRPCQERLAALSTSGWHGRVEMSGAAGSLEAEAGRVMTGRCFHVAARGTGAWPDGQPCQEVNIDVAIPILIPDPGRRRVEIWF